MSVIVEKDNLAKKQKKKKIVLTLFFKFNYPRNRSYSVLKTVIRIFRLKNLASFSDKANLIDNF